MYVLGHENFNNLFVNALTDLYEQGTVITVRGQETREFHPALFELHDPRQRVLTIPGRKHNPFAVTSEFFWIMAGRNDIEYLSHYLKNAANFSDDGKTWRAGYGPRLRGWPSRYDSTEKSEWHAKNRGKDIYVNVPQYVDQFAKCLQAFSKDMNTRQAVMAIFDPDEDYAASKDIPCTNWMHWMVRDGKLDLNVVMRSNDIIWGWSAVNVFNFTMMQELMACWLGVEVGSYYHMSDSFHLYEHLYPKTIESLNVPELRNLEWNVYDVIEPTPIDDDSRETASLVDFDEQMIRFMHLEENWRLIKHAEEINSYELVFDLEAASLGAFLRSNLTILAAYSAHKLGEYETAVKLLGKSNRLDTNVSCLEFIWRKVKRLDDRKAQTKIWASIVEHHKALLDLEGVERYILEG